MTPGHGSGSFANRPLAMLDAAERICHASLRSFTSRGETAKPRFYRSRETIPAFPSACFVSTWTLMPLRTAVALKHNQKADPPLFPRLKKWAGNHDPKNPKWRVGIERPRTGSSQSLPEAFFPLSFRRAYSGVGVSRGPDDYMLGPNQFPRPGWHRGYPQR